MAWDTPEGQAALQARQRNAAAAQPADTTTGTPAPTGLTADQKSARAILDDTLAQYGLSGLGDRLWQQYLNGEPIEQIMVDLRKTPEYKARFPGMEQLSKNGRAISEGEYISLERAYKQSFRQAGLPEGFYDSPDDFASFIANEVSPQEMSARLDVARVALYELPPQVRDEAARLYGLQSGDIMAFLLDPTKALPIIQQQFTAAQAGFAAQNAGYGLLTKAEAERLATSGKSFDQYVEGFDFLGRAGELFNPILGETGNQDVITRDEQLSIVGGTGNAAQRRLERRARERVAQFAGGGGYSTTQAGVTGLGSATS